MVVERWWWNDYFSRYPDAGITIDLSWDIAYELDGNANVTDDSARVMDHDDPVNVILSEIQQCFVELKELIDLELKHGKKVAAMAIICLSEKLLKSIIIEYVRTGSVSYYRLHLLSAYTRVIQAIAKKDSITGTCSEIRGLVGMLE